MKKTQTLLFVFIFPLFCFSQVNEINFNHQNINFSAAPRTSLNPMSIKLWDNYNNGGPTTFGTVLEIYGFGGHQTSQLHFGGWDNSKIRYREAFYAQNTWSDWITMLDSKNDVESSGNLKIIGNSNSYILNGNVGIGTANPSNDQGWSKVLDVAGSGHAKILATTDNSTFKTGLFSHATWHGSGGGFVGTESNHTLFLIAGYDPKVTILTNGNVGIGSKSPDTKLTVNGNIHAKEVKIDLNIPAPDYVFANDYKLKSLQEVEAYIKQNNHLPEIPSAAEFEKNGLMVAEMNMNLLKKIEELTLYVIEMKKENEKQQVLIEKLQNTIKHK